MPGRNFGGHAGAGLSRWSFATGFALRALVFVVTVTLPVGASAQPVVGSVSEVIGDATLERSATSLKATVGMNVDLNDKLTTGRASKMAATLSDGSRIELNESSSAVIDGSPAAPKPGGPNGTSIRLLAGSMRSFVNDVNGPNNFRVTTPNTSQR